MRFGKVVLSAPSITLFQSEVSSVICRDEEEDKSDHLAQAPTYEEPFISIYQSKQSELRANRQEREKQSDYHDFLTFIFVYRIN